jgi:hypothetical protein
LTETKKNHYSPRFANRPWANQNGLMIKYTRSPTGQLIRHRTGPVEWGQEEGLYPQELEDALANLERIVAPIYRCFLTKQPLDLRQRLLWSHWLFCQYSRTPAFIVDFAKLEEDILAQFPNPPQWAAEINTEEKLKSALDTISSTTTSKKLVPFLAVRDWVVCEAAVDSCFLRTDDPVVITGSLVREKTQILYPLSPRQCFVATVLGKFPPSAFLGSYQLSHGESLQIFNLTISRAEREVVVHPDDETENLRTTLQGAFCIPPGHFKVGGVPDLRQE